MSVRAPGRALVAAPLPPEFDREGGSRRIFHYIEFLLEAGWDVSFVCENVGTGSRYLRLLRQRGVTCYEGFSDDFELGVEASRYDVALFAFWYLAGDHAERLRELSPETRIIVESIDLHWLREARRRFGEPGGRLDPTYARDMIGEWNAYAAADAVLTVSDKESDLVNDVIGRPDLAFTVPDCETMSPSPVPRDERRGIVFIGNYRHPPNVDAVEFLLSDILPILPDGLLDRHPLYVVGNGLPDSLARRADMAGRVRMVGWVPSVVPYLERARVSVVPVRYGAGTKRKFLQALMTRTPSVSTSMGIEGIPVTPGRHLLVGDDAATIAVSIERLVIDDELWDSIAQAGRERVVEIHGRPVAQEAFRAVLGRVLSRPARIAASASGRPGDGPGAVRMLIEAVHENIPVGSRTLVVSRGDPALIDLAEHDADHFPRASAGGYAGFHPRDGTDAVEHLESLGPEWSHLVIPSSGMWWLDHYAEFREHLDARFERVWEGESGVIFRRAADIVRESRG